jgi:hypothetical protein
MLKFLLALTLIELTAPDGHLLELNADEIVTLRVPRPSEQHLHANVHCIVYTVDGKFVGVTETCDAIAKKTLPQ